MTALLLIVLLATCSTPEQRADPPARQEDEPEPYGDFRRPPTAEAKPTVPPPGRPETPPAKPSDCDQRCSTLGELNDECASRTLSCQRIIKSMGSADNDTCRDRNKVCGQADRALTKVEGCVCR